MTRPDLKVVRNEVDQLVRDIRPLLQGHHRSVTWGALCELVALWAIEHAATRSVLLGPLLEVHTKTIRRLVDGYAKDEKDNAG